MAFAGVDRLGRGPGLVLEIGGGGALRYAVRVGRCPHLYRGSITQIQQEVKPGVANEVARGAPFPFRQATAIAFAFPLRFVPQAMRLGYVPGPGERRRKDGD